MKKLLKVTLMVFVFVVLAACQNEGPVQSMEREGIQYNVEDIVSFYYPKDFTVDVASKQDKNVVRFVKDKEMIFYTTIKDDTDNDVADLPELYAGALEEYKADDVKYRLVETTSGLDCYEFTGLYKETGIKFKHCAYFTADAYYILGYHSTSQLYDENISDITKYLVTLVVNHK